MSTFRHGTCIDCGNAAHECECGTREEETPRRVLSNHMPDAMARAVRRRGGTMSAVTPDAERVVARLSFEDRVQLLKNIVTAVRQSEGTPASDREAMEDLRRILSDAGF